MNKVQIRNILSEALPGDTMTIRMVGDYANRSGSYKVLGTKRGRGRGASLLVDLQNLATGETFTTGTPASGYFCEIAVSRDGLGAFAHETIDPSEASSYSAPDAARASALKELFTSAAFVGSNGSLTVNIESTDLRFSGPWLVEGVRVSRGRYGQAILSLKSTLNPEKTVEVWSYRHSSAIMRVTQSDRNFIVENASETVAQ